MAITIDTLLNDYGSYSGNTLIGEHGATATIPNRGFGGVRGVPYDNITFIIEIDGIKYASSKWLSQQQNTPYQNESTVAGAGLRISTSQATSIPSDNQGQTLSQQESYAEVRVSKNLKTADEILKHINWLVDGGDSLRSVTEYGSWNWDYDTTPGKEPSTITSPIGTEFTVGVTYTGFSSPVAGGFVGKYNANTDYQGGAPGLRFRGTGWDGTVSGEAALSQEPTTTSEPIQVVEEVDSGVVTELIQPEEPLVQVVTVNDTPFNGNLNQSNSNTNTNTAGFNSTFGTYNYGYGYTNGAAAAANNLAAQQPQKPSYTGNYTGQYGYGPDGSTWVWIPGLGGWTKA